MIKEFFQRVKNSLNSPLNKGLFFAIILGIVFIACGTVVSTYYKSNQKPIVLEADLPSNKQEGLPETFNRQEQSQSQTTENITNSTTPSNSFTTSKKETPSSSTANSQSQSGNNASSSSSTSVSSSGSTSQTNPSSQQATSSNQTTSTQVSTSDTPVSTPQPPSQPTSNPTPQPQPQPEPEPEPEPTLPPESPSAIVAFYADSQTDNNPAGEEDNHRRVVNHILDTTANPVFHAGDLMEDGTQASLDSFNTVTETLRSNRTFYSALGNNDRKVGDSSIPSPLYLSNFEYPNNERWYSVNIGNLHMVILDSAFASASSEQLEWLKNDLQSEDSQTKITGVMFHHPTFASMIDQLLIDNGVDFVVSGHIHSYQHTISEGIHYFVTSGQPSIGYFIAEIYSDSVSFTVYNSSNTIIDNFRFNER